jgi:VanZ family protein
VFVCLNWSLRRPFGPRAAIGVVVGLAVYGALDELTQIPVGRYADVYDWLADCAGALAGVAAFAAVGAVYRRAGRRENRRQRG